MRFFFVANCFLAPVVFATTSLSQEISFNRDVRPLLANHCLACHGFDAKARQAELRLDDAASATEDRGGTFAIKPGDLASSEVWARVISEDPDVVMPPPETKKPLSDSQKAILRRWIEQGAPFQKHWAFEAPVSSAVPEPQRTDWARNDVDRFILAKLEQVGLEPQPEANRETLIRRVSFALTGLPPTLAELDRYLADESPTAYEKMVDRYLRSPHYGEEMARHWLDVARYADTHGLHLDNERQMWAYRDWVVKAFNENLPFDQFTTWQLAGDLLPHATVDQLVATGFNRCNVTTSEGGSIGEEFLYRYAVDRTATLTQAWMGLTGGCAVCHDHKYDPLTTKEFYSLYAFFYSAADPAMDGNINVTSPFIKVPQPGQQEVADAAAAKEQAALAELEAFAATAEYTDPGEAGAATERQSRAIVLFDDFFPAGLTTRNTSRNASRWEDQPDFGVPSGRRALKQVNGHFHEEILQSFPVPLTLPAQGRFAVHVRTDVHETPQAVVVAFSTRGGTKRLLWGSAEAFDKLDAGEAISRGPLPAPGTWVKLECSFEELGLSEGQSINSISFQQSGGIVWWDAPTITGMWEPVRDPRSSFLAWRKALAGQEPSGVPEELAAALQAGPDKPTDAAVIAKLRQYYLAQVAHAANDELGRRRQAWLLAKAERHAAEDAIAGTFIFRDVEQPREAFVMLRGQYDKPGERVSPNVPSILPPLRLAQSDTPPTRLDLARWLVSSEHPLTPRVTVNRFWQQLFGTGLVKTSADFGSQGEAPSHPELLDWLAIHYRDSGWNTRELMRMLVTSATFRQQARLLPQVLQQDPENRWYARGPRFRLDAEQIRDNVLFVSGLICLDVGGRGVKPYQPPNIWEPVGYADSNTRHYLQDHGHALYRRSLYCFLKRTAPPPFMSNFDGPNREQSCSRRERSNTPLQALQLMNDVQHFEAARALAARAITAAPDTDERLGFLYRTVLSRPPAAEELTLLRHALSEQQQLFAGDQAAAQRTIQVGESSLEPVAPVPDLAAWTVLANLILNLDETVNRN